MNATEALLQRVSSSKLVDPAPDGPQREIIFSAALRAADHGRLRPWRFLVIEGHGRERLGELFAQVAAEQEPTLSPVALERERQKPLRAPMIVVVVARCEEHPKVPVIEQVISAGAAAQNMITAAYALGLGAIWRTGPLAYDRRIRSGLGLNEPEQIVGFVYIGTPAVPTGAPPAVSHRDFFSPWPAL